MEQLNDVLAVNMETSKVRIIAENKSGRNAEAIVDMAVMRLGADTEFYAQVERGSHKDGDTYDSDKCTA